MTAPPYAVDLTGVYVIVRIEGCVAFEAVAKGVEPPTGLSRVRLTPKPLKPKI